MIDFNELVRPVWDAERWLYNEWKKLEEADQESIKKRVDELFFNEIPLNVDYDKLSYLRLFSLFSRIEVMGLYGMIKSLRQLEHDALYPILKQQVLDEFFHAIVFMKMAHQLAIPYAMPPNDGQSFDKLSAITMHEPNLGTSLVIINLLGEAWLEVLFSTLAERNIATNIFTTILADESRHLDEFDLYTKVGMPEKRYLIRRVAECEQELMNLILGQENYLIAILNLLGKETSLALFQKIRHKHDLMLQKIGLTSSKPWQNFIDTMPMVVENVFYAQERDTVVEPGTTRKVLSSFWGAPNLPTQSSIFTIDVTPVDFFEKKFPPQTITCLMLQALSKTIADTPMLKNYRHEGRIYNPQDSYVTLAVKLSEYNDTICAIEFKNCHEMNVMELGLHIENDIKLMTYCYKKVEELKKAHPFLNQILNKMLLDAEFNPYRSGLLARPSISLSNVGHWGYEKAVSPLFPNETVKLTLTKMERKQVWNNTSKQFEIKDLLPVGISVDHRVFDGNVPIPYYMQQSFNDVFSNMIQKRPPFTNTLSSFEQLIELSEEILERDLQLGFRLLFVASQAWKNQYTFEHLLKKLREPESA